MKKIINGFSLIELMIVIGILGVISISLANMAKERGEVIRVEKVGDRFGQYNNAVRAFLAINPTTPTATYTGTTWLKDNTCGGPTATSYIPCAFNDTLNYQGLTYSTVVTNTGSAVDAVTNIGPFVLEGDLRVDLAGVASSIASGRSVT